MFEMVRFSRSRRLAVFGESPMANMVAEPPPRRERDFPATRRAAARAEQRAAAPPYPTSFLPSEARMMPLLAKYVTARYAPYTTATSTAVMSAGSSTDTPS